MPQYIRDRDVRAMCERSSKRTKPHLTLGDYAMRTFVVLLVVACVSLTLLTLAVVLGG